MIAFVRGSFVQKSPGQVIVDVNGVGYDLHISLNTYSAITGLEKGQLLTYLHITENSQTLYGFFDQTEKQLFLQLISVSGIGASTARVMLSGMQPEEIARAIVQGNVKQLESIKGIGKKTAERLIVELKDKLGKFSMSVNPSSLAIPSVETDALNALISLGIAKAAAEQAIKKVISKDNSLTLEDTIKLALKNL
ncbi:MAG: Holliday junction branch migration protein RuvA [Filimonas sp.]|nr:Holliday junction branch migration protein RuvA [Filimonas sp.]